MPMYPEMSKDDRTLYNTDDIEYSDRARAILIETLGYEPDIRVSFFIETLIRDSLRRFESQEFNEREHKSQLQAYAYAVDFFAHNGYIRDDFKRDCSKQIVKYFIQTDPKAQLLLSDKDESISNYWSGHPHTANRNPNPNLTGIEKPKLSGVKPAPPLPKEEKIKTVSFKDLV